MEDSQTIGNLAKQATSPSPLAQLLDAQEKSAHLLQVLAERLAPVTVPVPADSKARENSGYHINSAVTKQYEINEALSYLIEAVVL